MKEYELNEREKDYILRSLKKLRRKGSVGLVVLTVFDVIFAAIAALTWFVLKDRGGLILWMFGFILFFALTLLGVRSNRYNLKLENKLRNGVVKTYITNFTGYSQGRQKHGAVYTIYENIYVYGCNKKAYNVCKFRRANPGDEVLVIELSEKGFYGFFRSEIL